VDELRRRVAKKNDGSMPREPWQRLPQVRFEKWLRGEVVEGEKWLKERSG